jgi:2-dehydropantoate 2-reductase
MRIAILGAGGVGGYFGGLLAQSGHEVAFIARGQHLEAIRAKGLRVRSVNGDFVIHPAHATDDPKQVGMVDYVVVAVKTFQLPAAAQAMKPLVGSETTVLPLLNGVEAHEVLLAHLGPRPVVGGLTNVVAMIEGPGVIRQESRFRRVVAGELNKQPSIRVQKLLDAWATCGVDVHQAEDIFVELWTKFLFLASFAGVSSLAQVTSREILACEETKEFLIEAMREVEALAHRKGILLNADIVGEALSMLARFEPSTTSSMQRDVMAGRPFELEALSGAIVRIGREFAIPTPFHSAIYALLLPRLRRAQA